MNRRGFLKALGLTPLLLLVPKIKAEPLIEGEPWVFDKSGRMVKVKPEMLAKRRPGTKYITASGEVEWRGTNYLWEQTGNRVDFYPELS